ncbi:MAG: hypothetical protein ACRYFZ_16765 [Janthinobacterium lividum]
MGDFLKPVDGYFSKNSDEYHLRVRETLLVDFSSTPLAGLIVLPSFAPEYALWIGKDWRRHYAVYRVGKTSIWQTSQQPLAAPVNFYTCNAELPPELAQALATVFWAALGQTRYPGNERITLDGTSYYFTAFRAGSGSRIGQTWSPNSSLRLGKLIALAESVIQHLTQPTNNSDHWVKLIQTAVALQDEFSDF